MKNSDKKTKDKTEDIKEYDYKKDYDSDLAIHDRYITDFDALESMLIGQVYDSVSKSVDRSAITDSYAATLAIERSARVMGKLPDGNVEAAAKSDTGKAMLMDIIRQKWITPNANSQHPFFTKMRMWQLYSSVYGYMPMFYDWNISNSGYVGPDCWLWNPRNLIPQRGRTSIYDMDYVTALSYVDSDYLEGLLDAPADAGWDIEKVKELIEVVENTDTKSDSKRDTKVARTRVNNDVDKGILLATRYEAGENGKWITFAPDNACSVLREIDNPHKNGKIPFIVKYSQPLFDSFYGMGDFQRARPLQAARDGLTNFYFHGIKMNLSPPIVVNANGVIKHTIDASKPAQVMMETIPNSIRRLETSTAGLNTYQAAQSQLTGSLLSLYGTQNASIPGSEALNPSQGKTPAAISMYSDKEATRDGQERTFMEQAIGELFDAFFSLIANVNTEDIPISMFEQDIQEIIESGYDDIKEMIVPNESGYTGTITIKADSLKGAEYRFNTLSGSTAQENKDKQIANLERLMGVVGKFQNQLKDDNTVTIGWAEMLQDYENLSGLPHAASYVRKLSQEEIQQQQAQKQQEMAAEQAKQQASQSQTTVTAPGGVVHESADLVKLYLGTTDEALKAQIIQTLGFQPSPPPPPQSKMAGVQLNDPHLSQAANHIQGL